jgi:hypothetical protein
MLISIIGLIRIGGNVVAAELQFFASPLFVGARVGGGDVHATANPLLPKVQVMRGKVLGN